jgi:hypothetical protein
MQICETPIYTACPPFVPINSCMRTNPAATQELGFRRTRWSPLGVTPVQIAKFHRGQRYQILPAYSQNSILLSRIFQGTTDSAMFEDFIEQLLHHCGRYPEPNSVLVMDNASFHRCERIEQMCHAAGVVQFKSSPLGLIIDGIV